MSEQVGIQGQAEGSAVAEADAASDAQMDEVLARITGGEDETPAPQDSEQEEATVDDGARERDEKGRFKSKETEEVGETVEETPDVEGESEDEPAAADSSVDPDDYRKALNALGRDGVPQSVIEGMDPGDVVEWGLKRASAQAKVDDYGRQLAEAKRSAKKGDADASATEEPAFGVDLKSAAQPFVELFGEDVAEPLVKFGEILVESLSGTINDQADQIRSLKDMMSANARETLRSELPKDYKLDKDDRWEQVLARRSEDVNTYSNEREALLAAARHVFADELLAESKRKVREVHKKRDAGQPMSESRGAPPPKPPSQDDLEEMILNAIQKGDMAEAQRLSGRRPRQSLGEMMGQVVGK